MTENNDSDDHNLISNLDFAEITEYFVRQRLENDIVAEFKRNMFGVLKKERLNRSFR